jgi:hypothetical protein
VDERVNAFDSKLRYALTGSNTFANMDEATSAKYNRMLEIGGPLVRRGVDPEAALNQAIAQHTREEKLRLGRRPGTERGSGLTYQGPAPWR